jgi:hypothetical protein
MFDYYPGGGMSDHRGVFDDFESARLAALNLVMNTAVDTACILKVRDSVPCGETLYNRRDYLESETV